MKSILQILLFFLCTTAFSGELETCKVIRIIDGDTVEVIYRGEKEKVRLYGIDTPERGEPGFKEATEFTKSLLLNRNPVITFPDKNKRDHFGRLLANLYIPEEINNQFINKQIYDNGYATLYNNEKLIEPTELMTPDFSTLLDLIIKENAIPVLKKSLAPGNSKISEKDRINYVKAALMTACMESNSPEMIQAIINLGVDINTYFKEKTTPLHIVAALNPNKQVIEYIISQGADIQAIDDKGRTPLELARLAKNASAITALVKANANICIRK